jgi:hypothetical protein
MCNGAQVHKLPHADAPHSNADSVSPVRSMPSGYASGVEQGAAGDMPSGWWVAMDGAWHTLRVRCPTALYAAPFMATVQF